MYQTLVNAIPKAWKNKLRNTRMERNIDCEHTNTIIINKTEYDIANTNCKELYSAMVEERYDISKAQSKYTKLFQIDDIEWPHYYSRFMKLEIAAKFKENQYIIIHDYIATNHKLYKMNLISSPRCNFCEIYVQDTRHMFYKCLKVKSFWLELNDWLRNEFGMEMDLNEQNVLLGELNATLPVDKIAIYAKYFIAKCKYSDKELFLEDFKSFIGKYMY